MVNDAVESGTSGTPFGTGDDTTSRVAARVPPRYVVRRWTFGGFVVQVLLLALIAAVSFGGGYVTKDRQELVAFQTLLGEQLAAQEKIVTLERQVMTLELARTEEELGRATVVEVDLAQVLGQLRDGVADTARARIDALAADITADLPRLGQLNLRNQVEPTGTSSMIETEASEAAPSARLGSVSELLASKPPQAELDAGTQSVITLGEDPEPGS